MRIGSLIVRDKQSKETFWAFTAKAISVFAGLFILILVPKYAGVEVYGGFTLLLAYQAIFGIFFGNPIQDAVRKEVAEGKFNELSKKFFLEGLRLKILLSILSSILLFILLAFVDIQILKQNFLPLLFLIIVMNLWGSVVYAFEASHRLFYEAVIYFVEYITKIVLILYFLKDLNVSNLLFCFIAGYGLAFLVGIVILYKKFRKISLEEAFLLNPTNAKIILWRSFFLALASISFIALSKIDVIMISFLLGIREVGYYNIASDLVKNATVISAALILGVMPLFVTENKLDLFKKTFKKLLVTNLLIFVTFFILSDFLVNLLYGAGFERVSGIIKMLSIYPLLLSLQSFTSGILILKDKTKYIFLNGFIAVILAIALNLIFIPILKVYGAAIATLISYGVWFLLNFRDLRRII